MPSHVALYVTLSLLCLYSYKSHSAPATLDKSDCDRPDTPAAAASDRSNSDSGLASSSYTTEFSRHQPPHHQHGTATGVTADEELASDVMSSLNISAQRGDVRHRPPASCSRPTSVCKSPVIRLLVVTISYSHIISSCQLQIISLSMYL